MLVRGLKQHPNWPITAKNKTYKYTMSLHYDIFSSHGLLPILHKFGKRLSLPYVPTEKGTKKQARITINKENCTSACAKTCSEGKICFVSNVV